MSKVTKPDWLCHFAVKFAVKFDMATKVLRVTGSPFGLQAFVRIGVHVDFLVLGLN